MGKFSLAIAIPTYCRSRNLAESLPSLLAEAASLDVTVYVSDDSPDNFTEELISGLAHKYDNLLYRKNQPRLNHDGNITSTLIWPSEDYVWLLGDALSIIPGMLREVVDFLDGQTLIFVNSHSCRFCTEPFLERGKAVNLIQDMVWHQTLTGATIYHRDVRKWIKKERPLSYKNFPQLTFILGYAARRSVSIGWFGRRVLITSEKTSYWRDNALDVFVDDWVRVVSGFPAIIESDKRVAVLRSHSKETNLFNFGFLMHLRGRGLLKAATLRKKHFFSVMHLPAWQVVLLIMVPSSLMRVALSARRGFRAKPS